MNSTTTLSYFRSRAIGNFSTVRRLGPPCRAMGVCCKEGFGTGRGRCTNKIGTRNDAVRKWHETGRTSGIWPHGLVMRMSVHRRIVLER